MYEVEYLINGKPTGETVLINPRSVQYIFKKLVKTGDPRKATPEKVETRYLVDVGFQNIIEIKEKDLKGLIDAIDKSGGGGGGPDPSEKDYTTDNFPYPPINEEKDHFQSLSATNANLVWAWKYRDTPKNSIPPAP